MGIKNKDQDLLELCSPFILLLCLPSSSFSSSWLSCHSLWPALVPFFAPQSALFIDTLHLNLKEEVQSSLYTTIESKKKREMTEQKEHHILCFTWNVRLKCSVFAKSRPESCHSFLLTHNRIGEKKEKVSQKDPFSCVEVSLSEKETRDLFLFSSSSLTKRERQ